MDWMGLTFCLAGVAVWSCWRIDQRLDRLEEEIEELSEGMTAMLLKGHKARKIANVVANQLELDGERATADQIRMRVAEAEHAPRQPDDEE